MSFRRSASFCFVVSEVVVPLACARSSSSSAAVAIASSPMSKSSSDSSLDSSPSRPYISTSSSTVVATGLIFSVMRAFGARCSSSPTYASFGQIAPRSSTRMASCGATSQ